MQAISRSVIYEEVLWECDACQVWWASQTKLRPTNLLLRLPPAAAARFSWDAFRGWRLQEVSSCPQCGQDQDAPAYSAR